MNALHHASYPVLTQSEEFWCSKTSSCTQLPWVTSLLPGLHCAHKPHKAHMLETICSLLFPSRTKSLTAICLSLAWFLASAYYFAYCFFAASWSLTCCNRTSLWPPASTNSSGLVVNFLLKNSSARLTSVVMWFVDLFVPAFPLCIFVYAGLPNLCCQLFLQSSTSLNLLPQSDYLKIQNQSKLPEQYH